MLDSRPLDELDTLIAKAKKGHETALRKLQEYYNTPLTGHIRGCPDYSSPEDTSAVVADTWEFISPPHKPSAEGVSFYSQLTMAAEVILRRHKIRNLALRASRGDNDARRILKNVYKERIWKFFKYKYYIDDIEALNDLENDTWEECFKKMNTLENGKSYNPTKASFMTWILIWARFVALRHLSQISKRRNREILESELGNEEDPIDLEKIQHDDDSGVATFSRILDPARQMEDRSWLHHCYRELLCTVFSCGAKPHQLISFVYQKLLEWKPQQIVDLLSDKTLWDSGVQGYHKYASLFSGEEHRSTAGIVDDSFTPLFLQLQQLFEIIYPEPEYEQLRKIWGGMQAGLTKIEIFYGKSKTQSVSRWTFKLKKDVRKIAMIDLSI